MWIFLTVINILGAGVALLTLRNTLSRYELTGKMKFYAVLRGAGMFALIFVQLYNMNTPAENWIIKLAMVYWWGSVLYWAWAVRDSGLKKTGNSITYTNQTK